MSKHNFLTKWSGKEIICICLADSLCPERKSCENLQFELKKYEDVKECMDARKYKRNRRGAIEQK